MDGPELGVGGHLGRADELVPGGAQEVASGHVAECPAAVLVVGHGHLEHARDVAVLALAGHVAVLSREAKITCYWLARENTFHVCCDVLGYCGADRRNRSPFLLRHCK